MGVKCSVEMGWGNGMRHFFKDFCGLFFFRRGPQHMPHSWLLLLALLAGACVVRLVDAVPDFNTSVLLVGFSFAWLAAFVALVLRFGHIHHRFVQTYTATLAVMLIEGILLYLVIQLPGAIATVLSVCLVVWSLAVLSNIMHYALECKVRYAVLLTLGYEILRYVGMYYLLMWWLT